MSNDEKVWEGDVLGRKQSADYLTKFLQARYQSRPDDKGFVLAINAEWGYGKTFMLQKWKDDLVFLGHPTIYFDAWQNDFTEEPLIAFISELDDSLRPQFKNIPAAKRLLSEVLDNAEGVITPIVKTVGKGLLRKYGGVAIDEITDAISDATDTADEGNGHAKEKSAADLSNDLKKIFDVELKTHKSRKRSITSFISKLTQLVETLNKSNDVRLPLFVFVDELDRCRPDYALQLLEGIKHLFGVPGVYFVVATNLNQLSEAVKAVYGNGFAGQDYLKRFFDLEYGLPEPNNPEFSRHLFDEMTAEQYQRYEVPILKMQQTSYEATEIFAIFATAFGLGLRDQQRIFKIVEAATYALNGRIQAPFLFFLSMLYYKSNVVFDKVAAKCEVTTEYNALMEKIPRGNNKFPIAYLKDRRFEHTDVTVTDIGSRYLSLIKKGYSSVLREEHNIGGWSQSIVYSTSSDTYRSPENKQEFGIQKYQYVIRQAGGFINT